tara:strand:+ start:41 stop:562 length:522 start_codon:yes stop_codon:yes gene_type:complete
MAKNRRGRPRKDRPLRDKGTPELQIKRITLVQGGNPQMSTTPLDIMFERQIITPDQYNSGLVYLYMHMKIFGKPFPQSNTGKLLSPIGGRSHEYKITKKDIQNNELFNNLKDFIVKETNSLAYQMLKNIVVFLECPPYLNYGKARLKDNRQKKILHNVLDSISKFFNTKKKKR